MGGGVGAGYPAVRLALRPQDADAIVVAPMQAARGRSVFEVPTDGLPSGPIEAELLIGGVSEADAGSAAAAEEIEVPDEIWLLERAKYEELLRLDSEETFAAAAELDIYGVWRLVRDVMRESLAPLALEGDSWQEVVEARGSYEEAGVRSGKWTEPLDPEHGSSDMFAGFRRPSMMLGLEADQELKGRWAWPANPLRWTLENVGRIVRDIGLNGFESMSVAITGSPDEIGLTVTGSTVLPLSRDLIASLLDEKLGPVPSLSLNAPWLALDAEMTAGNTEFTLRLDLDRSIPLEEQSRGTTGSTATRLERRGSNGLKYSLALDQGTTSSRAMVFDHSGRVVSIAEGARADLSQAGLGRARSRWRSGRAARRSSTGR